MHHCRRSRQSAAILWSCSLVLATCLICSTRAVAFTGIPRTGGNDVTVRSGVVIYNQCTDVAQNGDIYTAVENSDTGISGSTWRIEVFRSIDGGETFQEFGVVQAAPGGVVELSSLEVCEGTVGHVLLSYKQQDPVSSPNPQGMIAFADLSASTPATWNTRTVFSNTAGGLFMGNVDGDDEFFSNYYLYAVASRWSSDGSDIWFSRSTDQGLNWSTPVKIANYSTSLTPDSTILGFINPRITVGSSSTLHVAFEDVPPVNGQNTRGIGYVRASNFGAAPSDWSTSVTMIAPVASGTSNLLAGVAASTTTTNAAIGYSSPSGMKIATSTDTGATWPSSGLVTLPIDTQTSSFGRQELGYNATLQYFYAAGKSDVNGYRRAVLSRADDATPTVWTNTEDFSDQDYTLLASPAVDPSHGGRMVMTWRTHDASGGNPVVFDAEWRGDPGYPNEAAGFPLSLPVAPGSQSTSPALVNVNSDLYDEIVFSTTDGQVFVTSPVGAILPGWPQNVGSVAPESAVAVGDLNGDGAMSIVQGSADGKIYCFDGNGSLQTGFPVDLGTGAATFVSIGAVGPPYPRWIVAVSGNRIARVNYRGVVEFLSGTLDGIYVSTPAIGDVDNDGAAEIVTDFLYNGGGSGIYVIDGTFTTGLEAFRFFGEAVDHAPSLGNLDSDPELEICLPTSDGTVYAMNADLSDLAGFPFSNGTGTPITSVALGQVLGTSTPELAFASRDAKVHLLAASGVQQSTYPALTDPGWWLLGGPVLGQFVDGFHHVFLGSRDQHGYAFQNVFATSPGGWPVSLSGMMENSPAIGDPDKDGDMEVVFVTDTEVALLNTQQALGGLAWPMFGFDSQRTSCLNCSEDVVTALGDPGATRLSFRLASTNPSAGSVAFAATTPVAATVDLEIVDVRGRRVRSFVPEPVDAGTTMLHFDGRDEHGHRLARGTYFGRVHIHGDGADLTRSQKFVLVDR